MNFCRKNFGGCALLKFDWRHRFLSLSQSLLWAALRFCYMVLPWHFPRSLSLTYRFLWTWTDAQWRFAISYSGSVADFLVGWNGEPICFHSNYFILTASIQFTCIWSFQDESWPSDFRLLNRKVFHHFTIVLSFRLSPKFHKMEFNWDQRRLSTRTTECCTILVNITPSMLLLP